MKKVTIEVRKTYEIEVEDGVDPDTLQSTVIERDGKLKNVETEHLAEFDLDEALDADLENLVATGIWINPNR